MIKIAVAQQNFTTGDIEGNFNKITDCYNLSKKNGADLVIFSEMAITGYPCEDLVLRSDFQKESLNKIEQLAKITLSSAAIIIGGIYPDGGKLYNVAFILENGEIKQIICKESLPNFGVFDEVRTFTQKKNDKLVEVANLKLAVLICEDLWNFNSCEDLTYQDADILISINASPFETSKHNKRIDIAKKRVVKHNLPLIYINQIGGQDELVFDGSSFAINKDLEPVFQSKRFEESLNFIEYNKDKSLLSSKIENPNDVISKNEEIYQALVLGVKDYVKKNGFKSIILGMSGGIDSALSAVIATDSIGSENVYAVMLPSKYTSDESLIDAKNCVEQIGINNFQTISIKKIVDSFSETLNPIFTDTKPDLTEENIQSRIRGNILMAMSNKFGHMLLTTGNKSEMAVGYATLYGDMCGGFNALKDVYKTKVFELAKWRNQISQVIPQNIINKPPTAELRDNQRDDDSLPSYEVLDNILFRAIELQQSSKQIEESTKFDLELIKKITKLIKIAEYKRKQSPKGTKISSMSFDKERRYPIINGFDF